MILVIRLNLDKTKENYQEVVDALSDYDIASMAWEEDKPVRTPPPGQKTGDLGTTLSQSIDRLTGGR